MVHAGSIPAKERQINKLTLKNYRHERKTKKPGNYKSII